MTEKTAEIVRLTGAGPVFEPVAEVVELLERLLAEARAGAVKGFGYFLVDGANTCSTQWASGCASQNDMVAGVSFLYRRVLDQAAFNGQPACPP